MPLRLLTYIYTYIFKECQISLVRFKREITVSKDSKDLLDVPNYIFERMDIGYNERSFTHMIFF